MASFSGIEPATFTYWPQALTVTLTAPLYSSSVLETRAQMWCCCPIYWYTNYKQCTIISESLLCKLPMSSGSVGCRVFCVRSERECDILMNDSVSSLLLEEPTQNQSSLCKSLEKAQKHWHQVKYDSSRDLWDKLGIFCHCAVLSAAVVFSQTCCSALVKSTAKMINLTT